VLDVNPALCPEHEYFREMDAELRKGGRARLLYDLQHISSDQPDRSRTDASEGRHSSSAMFLALLRCRTAAGQSIRWPMPLLECGPTCIEDGTA